MKKVFLLFIAACLSVVVSAQKVYFIYLQTEDQTPFYVRMGAKMYSSASSGYLILPSLVDTTYYLSVGFAKSIEPEAKFSVAINQNDRGFLIKKFDDGVALFDFQELAVVKSNTTQKDNTVYETKTDNFSNVLSKAAGDPSIVKVPVVKKEEVEKPKPEVEKREEVIARTDESKPAEKSIPETAITTTSDTVVVTKTALEDKTVKTDVKIDVPAKIDTTAMQNEGVKEMTTVQQPPVAKEQTAVQEVAYKPSVVLRRSESSTTEGFGIVYYDKMGETTDTIRILIPASKVKLGNEAETGVAVEGEAPKEKMEPVVETKKAEISSIAKEETKESISFKRPESKANCSNAASEKDFMKLRKKMAAKENDDEMITEAKKDFRNKCFSVEQIRYLSTLFLTSAAKYQFFDAAYQHVSDHNNFASLQSEIRDEYYLKRFKALVGE
jgi:hypothetical protein